MNQQMKMPETTEARIDYSVRYKRCACCDKDLTATRIVGTGSFADGLFCSLDCFARFQTYTVPSNRITCGNDT